MRIEIWSDFACPYCYIGEARLKACLHALGAEDRVELVMKSFELDPNCSREVLTKTPERFAGKYGMTLEAAQARIEEISELGRREGLTFNYSTTRYSNMFDAHRLAKYAESLGHHEMYDTLFAAYFADNENLADHRVLCALAQKIGLDGEKTAQMLASTDYSEMVRRDEEEAHSLGIHGVPFFVINGSLVMEGAQPLSQMTRTLADMLAKDGADSPQKAGSCGPCGCTL